MMIPATIPGLRLATVLLALYSAIWISLEGKLVQVVVLGVGVTAVSLLHLIQRYLGGRRLSLGRWLLATAVAGLLLGIGSVLLSLFFMALKTGLHAHGPEFSTADIRWLWDQLPLWSAVGTLVGSGLGLLLAAVAAGPS